MHTAHELMFGMKFRTMNIKLSPTFHRNIYTPENNPLYSTYTYMYMHEGMTEYYTTTILGNKLGRVRIRCLEDLGELFIHPLNKHEDVPVDFVWLVRRLHVCECACVCGRVCVCVSVRVCGVGVIDQACMCESASLSESRVEIQIRQTYKSFRSLSTLQ